MANIRLDRPESRFIDHRARGTGGHNTADELETVKNSMIKNLNKHDAPNENHFKQISQEAVEQMR